MSWIYLLIAAGFEIGWPVGLKLIDVVDKRSLGFLLIIGCLGGSALFLWLAQREIPIGTAYAVWTGIGAAGTFLVGVYAFGDEANLTRYIGIALIILGVSFLKVG